MVEIHYLTDMLLKFFLVKDITYQQALVRRFALLLPLAYLPPVLSARSGHPAHSNPTTLSNFANRLTDHNNDCNPIIITAYHYFMSQVSKYPNTF